MHKVACFCVHYQSVAILREQREVGMRNIELLLLGDVNAEWRKRCRVQKLSNLISGHRELGKAGGDVNSDPPQADK